MSYALAFAPDAKSQWLQLDIRFQEIALDEVEVLASHPSETSNVLTRDIAIDEAGVRHYLFLRLVIDRSRSTVTVIGLQYLSRPL